MVCAVRFGGRRGTILLRFVGRDHGEARGRSLGGHEGKMAGFTSRSLMSWMIEGGYDGISC